MECNRSDAAGEIEWGIPDAPRRSQQACNKKLAAAADVATSIVILGGFAGDSVE
jgi:hypothetical protein